MTVDLIWKYGLQIMGEESVRRFGVDGHRKSRVMIEYQVNNLAEFVSSLS